MQYFKHRNNTLYAENVSTASIADQFGTPCYVYSKSAIETQWQSYEDALQSHPHLICYSVKANSNIAILNLLAKKGSGFDVVSIGEIERVLAAGGKAGKIIFSGVGKQSHEIKRALEVGIRCFNVESEAELERINHIAASLNRKAPVSIRVNPDVDPKTHPYISTGLKENKFGIDINDALSIYVEASRMNNLDIVGIDCHIGSQITEPAPFQDAFNRVLSLVDELKENNILIQHIDMGGGLGICYNNETPPSPMEYIQPLLQQLSDSPLELILEPGRSIVGNAGILLTTVEYIKCTTYCNFAIIDAAMNDLLRPALYQAWQDIKAISKHSSANEKTYDIVGPICESGDFLGKQRTLSITEGDRLAIYSAGAYGFTMSSNYNSRPRVAEVMVDNDQAYLIRKRETIRDLFEGETILPD
ncbi:MAG: diaminopimelate decarboxylase [Gammaproteobacteria bacterium]|nr:diaminopimelate decarboxylase [Gammaproteobacteria bacterium]